MSQSLSQLHSFAISVRVTLVDKPYEQSKDTNFSWKLTIQTTEGQWSVTRMVKEIEIFHSHLSINDSFRGVNFPTLPVSKKANSLNLQEYFTSKRLQYTQYLSEITHRSILLGHKDILDFIDAPQRIRTAAHHIMETEKIPLKQGLMRKEGEKWKGYRQRYFVLQPNYLLQYFESEDASKIGINPKGCIDLTLATKILVYDKVSNPFSLGIDTPGRTWRLQCSQESDRDAWVQALRSLLQEDTYSGYILDYNEYIRAQQAKETRRETELSRAPARKRNSDQISSPKVASKRSLPTSAAPSAPLASKAESAASSPVKSGVVRQLHSEVASYKQELDTQRETMVKWKARIEELSQEIQDIQKDRMEADKEYELQLNTLQMDKAGMKEISLEQRRMIDEEKERCAGLEVQRKKDRLEINKLETEVEYVRDKQLGIHDVLWKVQGDSVGKMKFGKMSKKFVVYVDGVDHLFYYDVDGGKESKYIVVKDVSLNNANVTKAMRKPWFMVVGQKRSALFASDSQQTRDKWVKFVSKSVGSRDAIADAKSSEDDEKQSK